MNSIVTKYFLERQVHKANRALFIGFKNTLRYSEVKAR